MATEAERYQKLVAESWDDPVIGPALRRRAKELFPDVPVKESEPAWEVADIKKTNAALADELKAMREERAAERKEREEAAKAAADSNFARQLELAAQEYSLTAAGKEQMRQRMLDTKNYTDPHAAAAWVLSQNPPAPPPGPLYGNSQLNFAGSAQVDDNYKLLHQNPEAYLDAEIRKAWDPRTAKDYVAKEMGQMYADLAYGR